MNGKRLWDMELDDACRLKDRMGVESYRSEPDMPFQGDALLELYSEQLDSLNYAKRSAPDLLTQIRAIALEVRSRLRRRHPNPPLEHASPRVLLQRLSG